MSWLPACDPMPGAMTGAANCSTAVKVLGLSLHCQQS